MMVQSCSKLHGGGLRAGSLETGGGGCWLQTLSKVYIDTLSWTLVANYTRQKYFKQVLELEWARRFFYSVNFMLHYLDAGHPLIQWRIGHVHQQNRGTSSVSESITNQVIWRSCHVRAKHQPYTLLTTTFFKNILCTWTFGTVAICYSRVKANAHRGQTSWYKCCGSAK